METRWPDREEVHALRDCFPCFCSHAPLCAIETIPTTDIVIGRFHAGLEDKFIHVVQTSGSPGSQVRGEQASAKSALQIPDFSVLSGGKTGAKGKDMVAPPIPPKVGQLIQHLLIPFSCGPLFNSTPAAHDIKTNACARHQT